jgi:hypothetical protein
MQTNKHHITENGRKKFVKDFNYPIMVCKSPYFEYYLELFEPYFSTKTQYQKVVQLIHEKYNGKEDALFGNSANMMKKVIQAIEETEAYKAFQQQKELAFEQELMEIKVSQADIYTKSNAEKYFISVDLSSANFNSLKFVNPVFYSHIVAYHVCRKWYYTVQATHN